jgi:hypothetical protein
MHPRALAVIAAWSVMGAIGCQSMSVTRGPVFDGGNSYLFANGKGVQGFAHPADNVRAAVIEAMRDLHMSDIRGGNTPGVTTVSAITADRRVCNVDIVNQSSVALVTAKVGALGDRRVTQALFGGIGARLGSTPALSATPVKDSGDTAVAAKEKDGDGPVDEEVSRAGLEEISHGNGREPAPESEGHVKIRRGAASDEVMLRNEAEMGYKDIPIE